MGKYVIGIDQGTTGTRAIAFDHDSNILSSAYSEFTQYFPQPGWVEHDAQEIYDVTMAMVKKCIDDGGLDPRDLVTIGITNQRETTVFWDKRTGKPLCPSIVWQDCRTADRCMEIVEKFGDEIYARQGCLSVTNMTGPKIEWVLQNNEEVRKGVEEGNVLFGWIDTWLIWKMSGGAAHIVDYTSAAATLMFDLFTMDYDEKMLKELGIPRSILPKPVRTGSCIVETDPKEFFGLTVPIGASAGDQNSATFAQACIEPGMMKNTYGTGSFMLLNTGDKKITAKECGLFVEPFNNINGDLKFCLEGYADVSGSAIQWLRDGLGIVANAAEADKLANSVPDSGGVYFVPAFAGLTSGNDPYARGTIIGITRGTTKAHICRAAVEAMAYQMADAFESMVQVSGVPIKMLRADGGGAKNDLLCQFQADILGVPWNARLSPRPPAWAPPIWPESPWDSGRTRRRSPPVALREAL